VRLPSLSVALGRFPATQTLAGLEKIRGRLLVAFGIYAGADPEGRNYCSASAATRPCLETVLNQKAWQRFLTRPTLTK
jgi:hypothetical protein